MDIEFEEVVGWNKKSDDGLEEKLGGNVVFGDKIEAGNDFGERLLDKELKNLVGSGEKVGFGLVSVACVGVRWIVVAFGKVSWSSLVVVAVVVASSSQTVGFSAEQLTSCSRTPSCQKVLQCSRG